MKAVIQELADWDRQREAEERRRLHRQAVIGRASRTVEWRRVGQWLSARLRDAPFWCGNERLHLDRPDDYWAGPPGGSGPCCTQHAFGLPRHRITAKPSVPAPHQLNFAEDVIGRRLKHPEAPIFHHLTKGRQMGFTEIAVRILAHQAFGPYAGRNIGIMAATNGKLAVKDMRRAYRLFAHIPQVIAAPLKSGAFTLINGTR